MKEFRLLVIFLVAGFVAHAQPSFIDFQRTYPRVASALRGKEEMLKNEFAAQGLRWPAKQMYIRSFKYDSQLEVWVRNASDEPFKLFKTYKVCALAGGMGPKRMEGDYQVPEGFYYINEFNPKSNYHLSLGINYPNPSDRVLSDSARPGGEIYIHGNCITVGCIPIQNPQIEELYVLAAHAKTHGQDFIPVHIFPIRYNNKKSLEYLAKATKDDKDLQKFAIKIKEVFDYFEENKKLPLICINKNGDYLVM
ncbi:L,D-transpeptidase family protein [Aridibaculum aurantiacum]|uniref:L,D-transpeptidase family protein n=1 Tax=Aridibaculum aurantiacum TaxID=2810307 RepID=UPI001A966A88|nr:L,D-transpeptidase family protein [Aridibaculum aurantiacum]